MRDGFSEARHEELRQAALAQEENLVASPRSPPHSSSVALHDESGLAEPSRSEESPVATPRSPSPVPHGSLIAHSNAQRACRSVNWKPVTFIPITQYKLPAHTSTSCDRCNKRVGVADVRRYGGFVYCQRCVPGRRVHQAGILMPLEVWGAFGCLIPQGGTFQCVYGCKFGGSR